jgi:hypothetical protein
MQISDRRYLNYRKKPAKRYSNPDPLEHDVLIAQLLSVDILVLPTVRNILLTGVILILCIV